jgi:tetratricopeptide (TPR) repeat protein
MLSRLIALLSGKRPTAEDCLQRGDAYMQEARLEDAYHCFEKAIKLEPESAEAWKRRSVTLGIMGCYQEAAVSLEEAIRIEPKDQEAWMLRGFCLVRLFRYSEARTCFERAMQLSQDEYARYLRDMLLEEMSREKEFRRARRLGMELVENAPG